MTDMAGNFHFAGTDDQPELAEAQKIAGQLNKLSGLLQKAVIEKMQAVSDEPVPAYLKNLCRLHWTPCQRKDGQQAVAASTDRARICLLAYDWLLSEKIVLPMECTIAHTKGQDIQLVIGLFDFNDEWRQKAVQNADTEMLEAASQEIISAVFSKTPTVN